MSPVHPSDVVTLRQQPGERDLRIGDAVIGRDAGNGVDDCQIPGHVRGRVTRIVAAPVVGG